MDFGRAIEELANMVPRDPDTFTGPDGLQLCKRCGGQRQCRVALLTADLVMPCACQCMRDEQERLRKEARRMAYQARVMENRSLGFDDKALAEKTFAADDGANPALTEAMKRYVQSFERMRRNGKGLLLYGDVGTGKTFFAACAVNALIDRGYPCLMTSFTKLSQAAMGRDRKSDFLDDLSRFALVAFDDLGTQRNTEYMNETVTAAVDALYRAKVPMIVTSNQTPKELAQAGEMQKQRVFDRLLERCYPIKVNGPSRRKQAGRDDFAGMRELLGV